MSRKGDGGFAQGRSTNRPPLFVGENFSHWKCLMEMYIKDQDMEMWKIIEKGPIKITKKESGAEVEKPEQEWSSDDLEKISKNFRALNILFCALDQTEFNRVCTCNSAKEVWDKLVVTYEGTSQVKQTKINIHLRQYELFKMTTDESIKDMFTRFTEIVNNLDSLGKKFTNEEKVRKILRSLPKARWEPKVTAIEEAQNLSKLSLDDLQGKLLTHEMIINEKDGELPETTKDLSLRVSRTREVQSQDSDEDEEDDPFVLISKGLERILKMKKQFQNRERSSSSRNKYQKEHKGKYSNSVNKPKVLTCYECGEVDHLIKDCPQKKRSKRFGDKDKRKKAMIASWSDSDSSSESESENEQANLCFMANHEEEDSNECLEATVRNLMSSSHEVLSKFLMNMIIDEENYISKIASLHKRLDEEEKKSSSLKTALENSQSTFDGNIKVLESRNQTLEIQFKGLESKHSALKDNLVSLDRLNNELEKQNIMLTEKNKELKDNLVRFTSSTQKLDIMLGESQSSLKKSGIGYNPNFPKKANTTFVKSRGRRLPICHHCGKSGHVKVTCPYRRRDPHIVRNNFPYQLKGQIKQIWVRKGVRPPNMIDPEYESKYATWSNGWISR